MNIKEYSRDAIINIFSAKLRSFLAVLGILVGTASVVAMVSGGELATRQALAQFKDWGTNLLSIQINSNSQDDSNTGNVQKLSLNLVENIKKLSPNILIVAPYTSDYKQISYKGNSIQGSIIGADQNLANILKLKLISGRFIYSFDAHSHFCVIGNQIYQAIKQYTLKDPIGQQLKLGNDYFTIVGVIAPWQQNFLVFNDLNSAVIISLPTALSLSKYADIDNIVISLQTETNLSAMQNIISNYFQQNAPDKQLYIRNPQQILVAMENQRAILTVFLAFIGGISLLVGGIGVMNIMLVSVTERYREIGIRLAVGAKRRDIQLLFLTEAVVLSLLGGALGVIAGEIISFIIAEAKSWGFTLFFIPPIVGFSVSVLVGIFFGFYPAYKASKLDPIQTLRSE